MQSSERFWNRTKKGHVVRRKKHSSNLHRHRSCNDKRFVFHLSLIINLAFLVFINILSFGDNFLKYDINMLYGMSNAALFHVLNMCSMFPNASIYHNNSNYVSVQTFEITTMVSRVLLIGRSLPISPRTNPKFPSPLPSRYLKSNLHDLVRRNVYLLPRHCRHVTPPEAKYSEGLF